MLSILSEEVRPMHFEISQRICQHCSLMGQVMNTQAAGTSGMLSSRNQAQKTNLHLYHLKPHNLNILAKCVFSSASSHAGALNTAQHVQKQHHRTGALSYQTCLLNTDGGSEQQISLYQIQIEQVPY